MSDWAQLEQAKSEQHLVAEEFLTTSVIFSFCIRHGADGVDVIIGGGVVEDVNEGPSTGLVEILVGLIVLVIGAVLYRRSTFFQVLSTAGYSLYKSRLKATHPLRLFGYPA